MTKLGRPLLVLAIAVAACSGEASDERPAPAPKPADAPASPSQSPSPSPSPPVPAAPAAPPPVPDTPGTHLDDDAPARTPAHPAQQTHVPARPIDITLRTTPSGARATIDGVPIGMTPTFWAGDANGKEHEFTFVYDGRTPTGQRFAVARYRFVPVTSGIIHVKLEPLVGDEPAAQQPQPPPR